MNKQRKAWKQPGRQRSLLCYGVALCSRNSLRVACHEPKAVGRRVSFVEAAHLVVKLENDGAGRQRWRRYCGNQGDE